MAIEDLPDLSGLFGSTKEKTLERLLSSKEQVLLAEKQELSDWEQFSNIFSNASLTLQNAWNSTQVGAIDFANYLGIVDDNYADNFIEDEYAQIEAINKKYADTGKGIVGGFEEGDLADVALGVVNALTSVVTTVAPAIATKGLSLVPQIMAPMYTEYNSEKAKMLYGDEDIEESIRKLRENEEDEVAVPMALGAASVALEKIGIKGISKFVLNNARTAGAKKIGELVLTGSREGLTEYFQGGLNAANIASAKGENAPEAVYNHLTSKDALEEFLQGFVGGTGISAAGAKINSAFRDDKDNLVVNGYINELGSLNQQKVNSKTKEAKSAVDKKIKKAEQDFKNFLILNQKKSEYLTEDQSKEIVNILDNKKTLESKVQDLQKQVRNGEINQDEYNLIIEDIKEQVELGNKNLNDIKVEANKKKLHEDLRTSEDAISGIKGLTQKVYKTPDEFLKAINSKQEKQYTLEDLQNVDGLIVNGEVMINETVAAENNAVTVGSHELLHGIVKSSLNGEVRTIKDSNGNNVDVDITVEGAKLIKEFLGTLNAKETKVVQKRIDDNYKYNRDKNGEIKKNEDGSNSEKAFEQYAEEYLTAYADAAIKNELSDSFLVKIGKFLSKIFNSGDKGYKNLEFKTGKDVKEFLKAYVSDRKKGKFRQQFVEMAREGAKTETVINKESRSRAVDAVNKMEQGAETKAEFQKPGIFNNVYNSITQDGGAINNYVKSLGLSKEKFQETIDSLSDRLMNYDPASKRKTETGEPITIGEFLMSNIGFAKLDAAKKLAIEGKRTKRETSTDVGATTKEGDVKMQVEDTDTSAQEVLDEQDMSVEGIAKREAKEAKAKKKRYSKLRQELGFETDGDTYNTVLDAARKSLLLAYGKTLKITNAKARVDKIVELIKKEYNSLNSDLFKPLKNFLGTKEYLINLKKFREVIVESIPTADLVQMEKFVPDNEKIFTTFVRKLTAKAQVQDAVDKNLLPKDALNTIDKGEAVNLYQKVMPSPNEFIGFANQPAINPDTGAKSGLKGTRKDGFAKRIAESLILDAVMEVRQETEVQQTLTEDLNVEMDVQQLASKIGREVDVKFSKSNAVTDINNAIDAGINTDVYLEIKFSKSHRDQYENRLVKKRPDLSKEQRENAVQSIFDFIDNKNIPDNKKSKYEKMAMHYTANGYLILPEDGYKIIEAERIATQKKLDPLSFKNPNVLIETYAGEVKAKRTNPDNVKTFSNKKELTNGVTFYDVEDSKQGQLDTRKVIDTHFGKKANPWCLCARQKVDEYSSELYISSAEANNRQDANKIANKAKKEGNNAVVELSGNKFIITTFAKIEGKDDLNLAFTHWKNYNKQGNGHQIAFQNGKLIAFRDGNAMQWWDRNDSPTDAVVVRGKKVGDGFREVVQVEKNKSTVLYTEKQTGNKKNGTYTKKNLNGNVVEITTKKDGRQHGEQYERKEKINYTSEITSVYDNGSRDSSKETRSPYKKFKGKSKGENLTAGKDQLRLDGITKFEQTKDKEGVTTTIVEGTVKQDMFEEAKNPDAIKDPFTKKNFKYLVLSNERYFPLQGKKVTVKHIDNTSTLNLEETDIDNIKIDRADNAREAGFIISKAKAEGKAAYMLEDALGDIIGVATEPKLSGGEVLVINSEVQETRVRFSRSANNEASYNLKNSSVKFSKMSVKQRDKTIQKLAIEIDKFEEDSSQIFLYENLLLNLNKFESYEEAVNVTVDTVNKKYDSNVGLKVKNILSEGILTKENVNSIVDGFKNITLEELRIESLPLLAKAYNKIFNDPDISIDQKINVLLNFIGIVGRSTRSGKNTPLRTNEMLFGWIEDNLNLPTEITKKLTVKIGPGFGRPRISQILYDGKTINKYLHTDVIRKDLTSNKNVEKILQTIESQAKEAISTMLNILKKGSRFTLEEKLAFIERTFLDQMGMMRKTYPPGFYMFGEQYNEKNTKLEHNPPVAEAKEIWKQYAKGQMSEQAVLDWYKNNNASVNVISNEINDALTKAGLSQSRKGLADRMEHSSVKPLVEKARKNNEIGNYKQQEKKNNLENLEKYNKLIQFSRSTNNPTKGITILDFDDTLATSSSLIRFTRPDGIKGTLTPEQYASTYEDLIGLDYKFDFSEFNKVVDGKPAPLLNKAKKLAGKFGTDNMFILTARPAESAVAIQKFLKENGLDIPLKNITGLGNSTADAKALWVLDKANEGYNDFYFADDAIQNVQAVQNMLDQIDVKSKVQQAIPDIIKQKVKFSKSSLKNTINSPQYKKFRNNIKNRVLYHGGSETIKTIRNNNAVWFYLDDIEAAQLWGNGEVYSVKVSDIQDMVVLPDLNDVGMFTNHIQEKFNLKEKIYDIREILKHPKADEILTEWMDWSSKNDMTWDIGYNLYEKGNVTNGAAVTVLGVIPKNKIQQVSPKFSKSSLRGNKAVNNLLSQIDVKSKVQQARVKFSKSMDKDFNDVLEDVSGIESNKRFSEAKARRRGKRKGKFRFFVPPSHEDFIGLLYNFMGRGEKGNQHRNFFEQALVKPLNRAYRELNTAKQAIANDYRALIKSMPDVRKKLGKKIPGGDFTNEDAIRVYLWDKFGLEIPGMSKTDQKNLVEVVKSDPEMQEFADKLGRISKDEKGYVQPSDNWDAGGIKYDLIDATGRIGRAKFFQEFIENSEIIFSEENLNKIEAIYGADFKSALKDMLYRVTKGTNRPTSKNKLVHRWLDWINGSVGATMFFNARSAVLQQLSFVNFMNFADNNVFKAAARFADQKQFWKDFAMIFNSDYLKQRRTGAGFDVNASEIAREVSGSKEPVRAAIRYILNLGFLPTQMGDSFAIAIGGASFLRNRINTYLKQGLSKKEAEAKAFVDFQQIAEATQQSARPDMISQQQASILGRFILAFQNVTSQYARIVKKSTIDLVKRRKSPGYVTQAQSDMANVSRIMYYGAIQSMVFYGLQSALFAMMFDDDEQDEEFFDKKKDRILDGTLDSLLKGMGVGGAVIATIKNYVIKRVENSKSDSYFKTPAWEELLQISPPIGIKIRKWGSAERTLGWNKDVVDEMELFDIDNPRWDSLTLEVEGFTNIPLNRLYRKVQNLRAATDAQNAWWQRVAVTLGWGKWDVGIPDREIEEIKKGLKGNKKSQSTIPNKEAQESENKEKQKQERKQNKKVICAGVTSKGGRCKKEVESGSSYCTIHDKVAKNKSGKKTQCKKMKQVSKKKKERCGMMTNSKSGYCYYHD